jgi:hypothetical protein
LTDEATIAIQGFKGDADAFVKRLKQNLEVSLRLAFFDSSSLEQKSSTFGAATLGRRDERLLRGED